MLQEMIENIVTKHLQNLIGDNSSMLPIESKATAFSEDKINGENNEDYLIEEPFDENIEACCSSHHRIYQNNEVHISEEMSVDEDELSFKTKETLVLNKQTDENSDMDRNMPAPELNQTTNQVDYNSSQLSQSVATVETVAKHSQTEEIVVNASRSQTEEIVVNASLNQTEEQFDKELLLEYFLEELIDYINVNSLSEIELGDYDKVYNDNVKDPFGYKVDVRCRGGRLLDFSTLHIKLVKQFEITVNSVIIEIELAFSKLEYSFNEFSIFWNMNLPRANIFTIKGNATAFVPDNSIAIKLVFMYNTVDNGIPLIKLVEDPNLGRVHLNVNRYPDEDNHNRNDNSFIDCLKLSLSYEYLANIKRSIVNTVSNALDHLLTSDNNFKLTIVQILNYLDDQDYPF